MFKPMVTSYYLVGCLLIPSLWSCHKSAIQKDSSSCEESGRVQVPANPETGRPAYCASGTKEQFCNLRDMKLDPATEECIAVTSQDVRMLYLDDKYSALKRANQDTLPICLGGEAYKNSAPEEKDLVQQQLMRGVKVWLDPLIELGLPESENRISFVEPEETCPSDPLATIVIDEDTSTTCLANRRACVHYEIATMYLRSPDGITDEVIVHEFGHIFGLADLYTDSELRPEEPGDFVTGCLKGFFASTMCHERLSLGPADIVGIKQIYCALNSHENCEKPLAWSHSFFGSNLGSCSSVDNEIATSFVITYDKSKALLGEIPYSGYMIEDNNISDDVVNFELSEDPESANGLFSSLNFRRKNVDAFQYSWNIKDSLLSGKELDCQVNPWLSTQ